MKQYTWLFAWVFIPLFSVAQATESFRYSIEHAADDLTRYKTARNAYNYYEELNRDSALAYADLAASIAQKNKRKIAEAYSLVNKAYQLLGLGKLPNALQCLLQSFAIAEDEKNQGDPNWNIALLSFHGNERLLTLSYSHHMYGLLMTSTENIGQQIVHFREAIRIGRIIGYAPRIALGCANIGRSFMLDKHMDSALTYEQEARKVMLASGFMKYLGVVEMNLGDMYQTLNQPGLAMQYYYEGIRVSREQRNLSSLGRNYLRVIRYHLAAGNKDSALYYASRNLATGIAMGNIVGLETNIGMGYENMYRAHQLNGHRDSAYYYLTLAQRAKDSLYALRIKNLSEYQDLSFSEQMRLREIEKEKALYRSRLQMYVLIAGILVLLLIAGLSYRNNRQKTKAKKQIEDAYDHLKSTQAQLVQAEKMASLGELTAGIAHEIQNPLNFVNNFSDINNELIAEAGDALLNGKIPEAASVLRDIAENEKKINHHGKRADAIVKGMLAHSRSSTGQKELTDINALCDEYLRLAYHGLRAKDKTFNAKMETSLDPAIKPLNIVTQDIGRVILNLINNAFYAVNQKQKRHIPSYEPTVTVTTHKLAGKTEIRIADNGDGIPDAVLSKIFQPFFTTKPSGEGTGLGLSLSYDIITKGHNGELKVETAEGKGTTFTVSLPA